MHAAGVATCNLEIEFTLKPGKRREFARSVEELNCVGGKGHVKSTVYEDRDEPGHMIWVAAWTGRESLEAYINSDLFGVLIGGIRVLSSETICRLVDGVQPSKARPAADWRVQKERCYALIDLSEFEGPKQ